MGACARLLVMCMSVRAGDLSWPLSLRQSQLAPGGEVIEAAMGRLGPVAPVNWKLLETFQQR